MKFILFLAKCIVGLLASIGLLVVASFALFAYLADSHWELEPEQAAIPDSDTVLTLDLGAGIVEKEPDNPFTQISYGEAIALPRAIEVLRRAAEDDRITGLILKTGIGEFGLAQAQELRSALVEFRKSGKTTLAFAETFGEAGHGTLHYYMASFAEEVWVQPSGILDVTGLAMESLYFREVLDDWGIEPKISEREEYKGALAFLTDKELPAPQRENLGRLMTSILSEMAAEIGESRNFDRDAVLALIDRAPYSAGEALELGLVDRLTYWDETGTGFSDEATYLPLRDYAAALAGEEEEWDESTVNVALIQGQGPIVLAGDGLGGLAEEKSIQAVSMAQAIADAIDDPHIPAIVLRLDSPGGSYVASDTIRRELARAKAEGVPVVVSMGNLAASGGYFIAASGAKIVAQPTTITGSIGVVGGKFVLDGFWRKLGVGHAAVKAGQNSDFWSPNRDFSPDAAAKFESMLDRTYADFMAKVAFGRNLTDDAVHELAKGQVWSGADALDKGLVDALGGHETALELVRSEGGYTPDTKLRLEAYPPPRDPFTAVVEDFFGTASDGGDLVRITRGLSRLAAALEKLGPLTEALSERPVPLQARSPDLQIR